jgi:hypothetical protein
MTKKKYRDKRCLKGEREKGITKKSRERGYTGKSFTFYVKKVVRDLLVKSFLASRDN